MPGTHVESSLEKARFEPAAATKANLIVAFYFAKRGFENVARIIKPLNPSPPAIR
jgi:hypothetical protein